MRNRTTKADWIKLFYAPNTSPDHGKCIVIGEHPLFIIADIFEGAPEFFARAYAGIFFVVLLLVAFYHLYKIGAF